MRDEFESYREALNGLRLTEESKRALAESLAHRSPAEKRRRSWPRPVLVAACLCAVLAGTALAAELVGGLTGAKLGEPKDRPAYDKEQRIESIFTIEAPNVRRFPLSTFPQEMLDLYKTPRAPQFASLEEAERYMGVKLAENPVLDRLAEEKRSQTCIMCCDWRQGTEFYREGTTSYMASTNYYMRSQETVQKVLRGQNAEGELIEFTADVPVTEVVVTVDARIYTEVYDSLETGDIKTKFSVVSEDGADITMDTHATPGGVEIPIARVSETLALPDGSPLESITYRSYFVIDGILYQVEASGQPEEEVLALLEEVLDGYEIIPSEAE